MTTRFINGAKYALSQAIADAVAVTDISNANPGVALAGVVPALGDIVLMNSGWPNLDETIARVGAVVAATSFELEDVDTTDLTRYPDGEGLGTYQIMSDFVGLSQVRDVVLSGGEQQFFQWQYVEDEEGNQKQAPTFKNARTMKVMIDYDPNKPWYQALIDLDRAKTPVVLRETLPGVGGDVIYYYGYVSFNKEPTKGLNQNMTVELTFSQKCPSIRYAG